jgi:hypothetical protein
MIGTKALLHLAAYSVSLPAVAAAPSKLAKETVYMPSAVAARVLGTATAEMEVARRDEEER